MTRESNDRSNLDPEQDGKHDPAESNTDDQPLDAASGESEGGASEASGRAAAGRDESDIAPERNEGGITPDPDEGSITSELSWLGRGFFQPLYSLQFYRAAAKKSLFDAIIFFLVFGTLITIISTFNLSRNLSSAAEDIAQAFASGEFPEITIENGLATVGGRQPLILLEGEGSIVILDTSGTYQTIDTSRYFQGFLLTRNSLHVYTDGDYQVIQLADLNSAFGNPIVFNRDTALDLWSSFTSIFSVAAFIGIGLWNLVIRMMWLAFLAVLVWGGAIRLQFAI